MKESEFIELLNLYIDHEIDADDAARLEAEVFASPERRKIYQQYCRMHRACCALAEQFRETAPVAPELPAARRFQWRFVPYAAGLMAAASFAFLVALRSHHGTTPAPAASAPAPAAELAAVPSPAPAAEVAQALPARGTQLHPVLDIRELNLASDSDRALQNELFSWMNRVRIPPVQRPPLEQFFSQSPVILPQDDRSVRTPEGLQAPVEKAAFRFER